MVEQSPDVRTRFYDMLNHFDTAMMATCDSEQGWHARPMQIADIDTEGHLWFLSWRDTAKISEIQDNNHVLLTFQDGGNHFVSLTGRAMLLHDRQKVEDLWQESFKPWFPQGKTDPNLVLIQVIPETGEYWDSSGVNKLRLAKQTVQAVATGTTAKVTEPQQHQQVQL